MGRWQGHDYEQVPEPENPKEAETHERRAAVYRKVMELGHPRLFKGEHKHRMARKYDVSYRQINYDMEAVKEYVSETMDLEKHLRDGAFVFEKAVSEAIADGNWDEAADIMMQQAEWLEDRGIIDKESVEKVDINHTHDWRKFIEGGSDESDFSEMTDGKAEIEVETDESS